MSYESACIPITKKMATFKQNLACGKDMDINQVGGINEIYGKRLRDVGICSAGQLKCLTKCMDKCEFESFLQKKACMNKLHAAMAYKCIHGKINRKAIQKAMETKRNRC